MIRSYDPEYEDWNFGKLSALREMALAIEGRYEYYYMGILTAKALVLMLTLTGYYIHSCVKMRYKGTFAPSYILGTSTST